MSLKPSRSRTKRIYYPLFLDITDKECLVLGGGEVAIRKVSMLLDSNAGVTVVSPVIGKELAELGDEGKITLKQRQYKTEDLRNTALVFACTDNKAVNKRVKEEAAARHIPVNVVDDPGQCDFVVPSVIRKGNLTVAVSTSGELPLLSKKIREKIEETITDEYLEYLHIVGQFRKHLIQHVKDGKKRRAIMQAIGTMEIGEVISGGLARIKKLFPGDSP